MADETVIDALRAMAQAANVSEATLARVAEVSRFVEFADGATLFREGDSPTHAYFVCDGRVALQINVPPRGATRLLTLGAGELVGWSPFLGGSGMTASAVAIGDVSLVEVDAKALRGVMNAEPRVGFEVMRWVASAVSKRLTATRLQLLDIYETEAPPIPDVAHAAGSAP